ncbi:hypothetical protein GCM10010365_05220 [Streptomyces poonensis]|uniref:Putative zinc-finger domain-containing protein n=1 Tax=Streptomyces poonensis TaxID=68255 RepID=A0A918P959_9ACTN|nr:hypothetical protein GCM10010365_05220 [Streptomyces poonensis]GLJ88041.1 hypothetical protein GCM10017589_06410 [Streptomyces poonensis]
MSGSRPNPGERRVADQHLGDRLSALVDGELGHEARERVLAHLATCPKCKAEADAQRRLKNVFAEAAPPSPSESFLARLQGLPGGGGIDGGGTPPVGGGFGGGLRSPSGRPGFPRGTGVFGVKGDPFGYVPSGPHTSALSPSEERGLLGRRDPSGGSGLLGEQGPVHERGPVDQGPADGMGPVEGPGPRGGRRLPGNPDLPGGSRLSDGPALRDGSGLREGSGLRDGWGLREGSGLRDGSDLRDGPGPADGPGFVGGGAPAAVHDRDGGRLDVAFTGERGFRIHRVSRPEADRPASRGMRFAFAAAGAVSLAAIALAGVSTGGAGDTTEARGGPGSGSNVTPMRTAGTGAATVPESQRRRGTPGPLLGQGRQFTGATPVVSTVVSAPLLPGVPAPAIRVPQEVHPLGTPVPAGTAAMSPLIRPFTAPPPAEPIWRAASGLMTPPLTAPVLLTSPPLGSSPLP